MTRRRPGQRAIASKAQGLSSYDLDEDRRVRAKAKFSHMSLGQASKVYFKSAYDHITYLPSYIASEKHLTIFSDEISEIELELIFKLKQYESGSDTPLSIKYPAMYEKIRLAVVSATEDKLAIARRARHTPHVLGYARYLSSLPRNNRLALTEELYEQLPY